VKHDYLSIQIEKQLPVEFPGCLNGKTWGRRARRIQNLAGTFDLASAAITRTNDDALEAKAQQITRKIEDYAY
jgi:hypothetical protein